MATFDIDAYVARTGALDVRGIDWADVARYPVPAEAIRALRYMQDIESHTDRLPAIAPGDSRDRRPDVARFLACWVLAPVGSGVQPRREFRFLARYLFSDARGRAAARKADETIRRLPGFATVGLLESWLDRFADGGLNGDRGD
jgi:hypothetical protein